MLRNALVFPSTENTGVKKSQFRRLVGYEIEYLKILSDDVNFQDSATCPFFY